MTKMIALALMALTSLQAQAADVESAQMDASGQNILVNVRYGGGCGKHEFVLQMGMCMETFPVRCTAQLVDIGGGDPCEAMLYKTVVIPLEKYNLNDKYFSGANLTIQGDKDWQTGKPTQATVVLPQ